MIPLILAAVWPPFAAASLLYRSDRAAALLAGWLVAAVCMAMDMYFGWVPAEAVAAVWMVAAAVVWVLFCPPRPSRRERRREVLDRRYQALMRQAALEAIVDEAREELDGTNVLVPVIKNAPRRVA
jgi:type IV secretory pathway TrbD component